VTILLARQLENQDLICGGGRFYLFCLEQIISGNHCSSYLMGVVFSRMKWPGLEAYNPLPPNT
jgi:hypothetical protein